MFKLIALLSKIADKLIEYEFDDVFGLIAISVGILQFIIKLIQYIIKLIPKPTLVVVDTVIPIEFTSQVEATPVEVNLGTVSLGAPSAVCSVVAMDMDDPSPVR